MSIAGHLAGAALGAVNCASFAAIVVVVAPAVAASGGLDPRAAVDRLEIAESGSAVLWGRGPAGTRVRVITPVDGTERALETNVGTAGVWQISLPASDALGRFRFRLQAEGDRERGGAVSVYVPDQRQHHLTVRLAQSTLAEGDATRRRAEDLARAASRRFDAIQDGAKPGSSEGTAANGAVPGRMAQAGGTGKPTTMPSQASDPLAGVWDWLKQSSQQYREKVLPKLSTGNNPPGTDRGPKLGGRPPEGPPSSQERPTTEPSKTAESPSGQRGWPPLDGVKQDAEAWLERARKAYREQVVPKLAGPGGSPLPDAPKEPARTTVQSPGDNDPGRAGRAPDEASRQAETELQRERDRAAAARLQRETQEREQAARERTNQAKIAAERARDDRERADKERADRERLDRERVTAERDRAEREARLAAEREQAEKARIAAEQAGAERARIAMERAKAEQARLAGEKTRADQARQAAEELARKSADAAIRSTQSAAERARRQAELVRQQRPAAAKPAQPARDLSNDPAADNGRSRAAVSARPALQRDATRPVVSPNTGQRPAQNGGGTPRRAVDRAEPSDSVKRPGRLADRGTVQRRNGRSASSQRVLTSQERSARHETTVRKTYRADSRSTLGGPPVTRRSAVHRLRIVRRVSQSPRRRPSRHSQVHVTSCQRAGRRITPPGRYVVASGDSLWRISRRHYKAGRRFRIIFRANRQRIANPDLIYPCQRLVLPRRR